MKRLYWILIGLALAVTLVLEFTVLADYQDHWWNAIPAFYMLWGGVCMLVVIFVSKIAGQLFLLKDDNYYDS